MGVPVIYAFGMAAMFVVGVASGIKYEQDTNRDRTRDALDALARIRERAMDQRQVDFPLGPRDAKRLGGRS